MADFKVVIANPKTGKCVQKDITGTDGNYFLGKKVGDKVEGAHFGLSGYEFELTGGSDKAGFPMRRDVQGTAKKRILAVEGTGVSKIGNGIKQRKTVAGNTVGPNTIQLNLKMTKEGSESIFPADKPAEQEKAAEAPAQ